MHWVFNRVLNCHKQLRIVCKGRELGNHENPLRRNFVISCHKFANMLNLLRKFISTPLFDGVARASFVNSEKTISTTSSLLWIHRRTRLRVVDNSALGKEAMLSGKPPYCIHVYRRCKTPHDFKAKGQLGDKILVAIKGQMKKAYVVGWKWHISQRKHGVPRMDTNNIVLLDDNGNPLGTRVLAPIPGVLRAKQDASFAKILAIATKII